MKMENNILTDDLLKKHYGIDIVRSKYRDRELVLDMYNACPETVNTCRLVKASNGVVYIQMENLLSKAESVMQAFSTRLGGVSTGIYESMNLCGWQQDNTENVFENYSRFAQVLNISVDDFVCSQQTHTNNCIMVKEEFSGMGVTKPREYHDIDALICDIPGKCLVTYYADCTPVIVADKVTGNIGAAHAGWRGTVSDIAGNMVELMKKEYKTKPENLVAMIGPCICEDCYEVSEDVAEQFKDKYSDKEQKLIVKAGKQQGKYQLNLMNANMVNLINAGIDIRNISISDLCTGCNSKLLFSHRATAGKRGLMANFIYKK